MPLSEFKLIAEIFAPLATSKSALGLKDDVAVLRARAGKDLILKTDTIVEGVDFFRERSCRDTIAKKALRVNLSDLAAKGAEPFGYLLTLVLQQACAHELAAQFRARPRGGSAHIQNCAARRRHVVDARAR